jgi:hypothetical protein
MAEYRHKGSGKDKKYLSKLYGFRDKIKRGSKKRS